MEQSYGQGWVEAQVERAIERWESCALASPPAFAAYTPAQQQRNEKAYDQGLRAVQREARRPPRTHADRLAARRRIVALFPAFASVALGLDGEETELITNSFLPVGTELARWARDFDRGLSTEDTIQACRNAWTCCGMQGLLGQTMQLTPSVLGYSLLYPYSDNFLDSSGRSAADKLRFSHRFRRRLCGELLPADDSHEAAVWTMVQLIEQQYPRMRFPQVYGALLAIHRAQEESMAQMRQSGGHGNSRTNLACNSMDTFALLRISCAKGGTSVLADAFLAAPELTSDEIDFAFDWGVLLQLGDDLQDVREDLRRGSVTLFTQAISQGKPLDSLIAQLLHFSNAVAEQMDRLPNGTASLKSLLRMSWRSLVMMAAADVHTFCTPAFLAEIERCSSFRFKFLRARNENLSRRKGLYNLLFDAFIEAGASDADGVPLPRNAFAADDAGNVAGLCTLSNSLA